MDLKTIVSGIDAETARAFVTAARHAIDALLIEAERVRQTQTPTPRDYNAAALPRGTPPGGWLAHEELRETARRMAEAIAVEKWVDGFIAAVQVLSMMGGAL